MAYTNKFKDRNPCIATAGFSQYKKNENVENCLIFPVLDTLPTELKIKPSFDLGAYSLPPLKTDVYEGVNTKMRELINPPLKNMSQNLRQELDETVYDSYWNKGLGKIRSLDLPEKLDKYTTCFGKKTVFGESVKELVNPDKTPGQVITESDIGHDLYVKTHNDYYPGEQADRRYNNPPLNKNLIWGEKITSDPEGGCTKKVLKWFDQNNLTAVNEIQARYKCFSQPQVGKVFAPNQNITCVPKHHTFGKLLKRELFGVGDLMRDCAPSQDKIDLSEELVHINLLRNTIRKRVPSFPYRDFLQSLIFEDKGNSGWIPLPTLYDICTFYGIQADRTKLNALLFRLGILLQDGMVKYKDFAAVINVNSIFPPLAKLNDIPPEFLSYETTYKEATKSKKRHFKGLPIAGLPSWWTVRHNLNSETSMEAVMSPNIFTQYGLSHRDFFRPRSREYINELFKRIGVCLPTEMFHQIYDIAKQQDATGGVCIETFRNLLDKQATKNFKLNNN